MPRNQGASGRCRQRNSPRSTGKLALSRRLGPIQEHSKSLHQSQAIRTGRRHLRAPYKPASSACVSHVYICFVRSERGREPMWQPFGMCWWLGAVRRGRLRLCGPSSCGRTLRFCFSIVRTFRATKRAGTGSPLMGGTSWLCSGCLICLPIIVRLSGCRWFRRGVFGSRRRLLGLIMLCRGWCLMRGLSRRLVPVGLRCGVIGCDRWWPRGDGSGLMMR